MFQILIIFLMLFFPDSAYSRNQSYEVVRFHNTSFAVAQVDIWDDLEISPARYAVGRAVYWYEKEIGMKPSPRPNDTGPQPNPFLLVFLGRTQTEVWTLEAGVMDDAEGKLFFNFVRTGNDGRRSEKKLIDPFVPYETNLDPQKLERKLLDRLWQLTGKLSDEQNRLMTVTAVVDLGAVSSCSIRAETEQGRLCYLLSMKADMCWHHYSWTAVTMK